MTGISLQAHLYKQVNRWSLVKRSGHTWKGMPTVSSHRHPTLPFGSSTNLLPVKIGTDSAVAQLLLPAPDPVLLPPAPVRRVAVADARP